MKMAGFALLFLLMLACQRDFDLLMGPSAAPHRLLSASMIVKPNGVSRLWVENSGVPKADRSYRWSATMGLIEGTGDTVDFYAPDTAGWARIRVTVNQGGTREVYAADLLIASQIVILKADDWTCDASGNLSDRWGAFTGFIQRKKIKACLGIIGQSLQKGNADYFRRIRELNQGGHFEFWNHGYDHMMYGVDAEGRTIHEFFNTSLADQKSHLLLTQSLAWEKTGLVLTAFGAPGNAFDENTSEALREFDDIRVWFYGSPQFGKTVLSRCSEIEFPAHRPDFAMFAQGWDSTRMVQAFQIHPDSWDESRFEEFRKCIDLLIARKAAFLTSREYDSLARTNQTPEVHP